MNPDSKRLIDTAFPEGGGWIVQGHYDAADEMKPLREGPAGSFALDEGDDTYFCVGTVAASRKDIGRVMVLVIDDVGKEIDKGEFDLNFPLEPSFVVESSKGSFQYGYIIEGGMDPTAEYAVLRRAMKASPIWGAAHNTGIPAIFRLPQGTHTKSTRGGWKVRLAEWTGKTYSEEEIWSVVPEGLRGVGPAPVGGSVQDLIGDEDLLRDLVSMIPNDRLQDWGYFVNVGRAIWGASEGAGSEIYDEWAERWTAGTAVASVTQDRWDSFHDARIGRYWLLREARAASPAGVDEWLRKEKAGVFPDEIDPAEVAAVAGPPRVGPPGPGAEAIDPVQRQVADSIVRANGGRLRFNHDSGCWHKFDGNIWKGLPRSVKAGFLLAERWAAANAHLLGPADFKAASKANFYDGVENILRQRLIVRQEDFDADPWLIGTPGGTVDLKTGLLRGALAGDFISKATSVAPALVAACPRWKKFVSEICKGDPAAQVFIQQWFGYCLTGDTSEQIFLFLYGPGGNGKSVLVDTMAWVLGDYFRKPVADLYFKKTGTRHAQEIAMLAGARMVSISEVPSGAAWDESRLKEHTGGGHVTANFMRENAFTFTTQFKLTVQGNHQPTFPGGINPAIQRRFKMMLLDFVPAVVDKRLEVILKAEGAGILRWALEGLCHPSLGWHTVGLMIPASVDSVTDEFVADQDVFAAWVGTRIEKKPGVGDTKALFDDWIEFRNAQGNSTELYSNVQAFVREMERRGFHKARITTVRGFRDIALKSKAKEDFDD